MGQEDDSPETENVGPLQEMPRRCRTWTSSETTCHQSRGGKSSKTRSEDHDIGEPCALKGASTVRMGGVGKVPAMATRRLPTIHDHHPKIWRSLNSVKSQDIDTCLHELRQERCRNPFQDY